MNEKQFLKEVNDSGMKPDGFDEAYEKLKVHQSLALKTLLEFHRVCKKNGIQYQIAYGTLLGIIRDHGPIPWDYDVDVLIDIADREKLVEALRQDLSDEFYPYSPQFDVKCRHEMILVVPKGYDPESIHVDVFFLTGLPDNTNDAKKMRRKLFGIARGRYCKLVDIRHESKGDPIRWLKRVCGRIYYLPIPLKHLEKEYEHWTHKYPLKLSKQCTTPDLFAKSILFDTRDVLDTHFEVTAIGELSLPDHYDELLRAVYGDYTTVPPLEQRLHDVMRFARNI